MFDFIVKYWIQFAFGLLISGGGAAIAWMSRKFKEHEALNNGLCSLLRSEIIHFHDKYMERKYIPIYALDSINKMYDAYHALGGNGTATKLVQDLRELPNEPIKNEEE